MSGTPAAVPHSERLLVVVGPSGAGKDTLMAAWRQRALELGRHLHIARRTITRPALAGGEAHEALSHAHWQAACESGAFAMHWHANGLAYGVRMRELEALAAGPVLLNGSRAALPAIRAGAPDCRVVHITASPAVLAERLKSRGREDARQIEDRLARAPRVAADFTLSNDGPVADSVAALMQWWEGPAAVHANS
ncbi:MAG: phosphonate metabolism protein/1,5-bisphosphokinase (PRPP-forming) PhnN [Variovorax sp.]|nr:phosphonate metabolism protein/1,5-bisphosphokinase (PRPP-forming) PhnN [Variovorax sp.]